MAFETEFDRQAMFSPQKIASGWDMASFFMQGPISSGWDFATMFSDAAIPFNYKRKRTSYFLKGIFDSNYIDVTVVDPEMASETPMMMLPTKALPIKPEFGDKVIIECEIYAVRNIKSDGTGVTMLILEVSTDLDEP